MIDDKKLLCAFIYSAYESGYCGILLNKDVKQEHMKLYKNYILNEEYFPKKEISETQQKMMSEVNSTSIRDYVYSGHYEVVKKRIEDTTGDFVKALKSPMILHAAVNCPINFYKVLSVSGYQILGKNIFIKTKKVLKVLNGLEIPKKGDVVSGHWNYFLEIIEDSGYFKNYEELSRGYLLKLQDSIK